MENKEFNLEKSINPHNSVYLSKLLDPYTAHIAKWVYNLGLSANNVTFINFILGLSSIYLIIFYPTFYGLILSAVLLTLRNIGDTIDGKIARGSNTPSALGAFSDIISDWIIFHAAFFIAIGYVTDNLFIGFLCVTGYMSREFARRKFEHYFGKKVTETEESKSGKMSLIKSIVTKYDLANVFWIIPFLVVFNQLEIIIYFVAAAEYLLLLGELSFDFYCFFKKNKTPEISNTQI